MTKPKPTSRKVMEGCAVAVILSMVIGNMFVARRMKSFMKAKVPDWEAAKDASGFNTKNTSGSAYTSSSSNHSQSNSKTSENFSSSQESTHFKRRGQGPNFEWRDNYSDAGRNQTLSANLLRSLSLLGLPHYPIPSTLSVKNAYYRLARQYHPDRFPSDHPEKKAYEQKFKNISLAYKECLEKLPSDQKSEARM